MVNLSMPTFRYASSDKISSCFNMLILPELDAPFKMITLPFAISSSLECVIYCVWINQ